MTNEECTDKILALEKHVLQNHTTLTRLVAIVGIVIEQNERLRKHLDEHTRTETDTWPSAGGADESPLGNHEEPLPVVYTTNEPPPSREQEIKNRANHLLTDAGKEYRKQVEAYLKNKADPQQRRLMLNLFLEIEHKKDPKTSAEDAETDFQRTDDEIEEMLQLDLDVAAVELLKSQGK